MKKVGIVTLNGYYNYGNRLQNYATEKVLESIGFQAETIINTTVNITPKLKSISKKDRIRNFLELDFSTKKQRVFSKAKKIIFKRKKKKLNKKRELIFKKFTSSYITETDFVISKEYIPTDINKKYDFFVTGSDQVWHPNVINTSTINLLTFAQIDKRIAYAASFGVSSIQDDMMKKYKLGLSEMKSLSVREKQGAEIVKNISGRDAVVLIDPTMMLTKEEWLNISTRPQNINKKKYILTYFLGNVPHERKSFINMLAKEKGYKVINLLNIRQKQTYLSGPSEFIEYINSASVFFTDSFHGIVFSILMQTPFIVCKKISDSMSQYSRIETLLEMFGYEEREEVKIKSYEDLFNIDFSHVDKILKIEREKAILYLKNALVNINEK